MLSAHLYKIHTELSCYQGTLNVIYPTPFSKKFYNPEFRKVTYPNRRIGAIHHPIFTEKPVISFSHRAILSRNRSLNISHRAIGTVQRPILSENRAILRWNRSLNTLHRTILIATRGFWLRSDRLQHLSGRFSFPIGRLRQPIGVWHSAATDFLSPSGDFALESVAKHSPATDWNYPAEGFFSKIVFYQGKTTLFNEISNNKHHKYQKLLKNLFYYDRIKENQFDCPSPEGCKLIFNTPFRVGANVENHYPLK